MEKSKFFEQYRTIFSANGLGAYATEDIMDKMYRMVEHMLEVNSSMNLTAITDWNDILVKHLADSCTILPYLPQGAKVCDVGCGGGFPSIPIAIARPDVTVTGIDSTGKKVNYINQTAELLGLGNLNAICGRAEELASTELRESFDVVTARAVAALPVLCELCLPFVKEGGLFLAMKAGDSEEEINEAKTAIKTLGGKIERVVEYEQEGITRCVVIIRKISATPKGYPRAFAKIKKNPL